jgi:hypothetical protein
MPIGYDSGGGGYQSRPPVNYGTPAPARDNDPSTRETTWRAEVLDETHRILERWYTAGDARTCPICAPLNGTIYWQGEGPYPPLHPNCRCQRLFDQDFVTVRYYWKEVPVGQE